MYPLLEAEAWRGGGNIYRSVDASSFLSSIRYIPRVAGSFVTSLHRPSHYRVFLSGEHTVLGWVTITDHLAIVYISKTIGDLYNLYREDSPLVQHSTEQVTRFFFRAVLVLFVLKSSSVRIHVCPSHGTKEQTNSASPPKTRQLRGRSFVLAGLVRLCSGAYVPRRHTLRDDNSAFI